MGHHDKEYVYLFMCYRDRNVRFTFCGTLLALEYNGMTLYDIILSPQSSVLNRIGNFFHKTAERKNNIFHRFYLERIKLFVYLRTIFKIWKKRKIILQRKNNWRDLQKLWVTLPALPSCIFWQNSRLATLAISMKNCQLLKQLYLNILKN